MNLLLFALLCCGLLFSTTWSKQLPNENDKRALGLIAKAVSDVTIPMLTASRKVHGPGTNLLYSPFSISVAMAMLLEGSGGNTQKQIVEALQLQSTASDLEAVRNGYRTLLTNFLQESGEFVLDAANAVFVQENVGLKSEFRNNLMQYYMAVVESKDFQGNTAGVEQEINDLVRRSTRNEIPQFLPPGTLSADTIVYLLSAVYFSGTWDAQFPRDSTVPDTFHLDQQNTKEVEMMNMEAYLRADYIEQLNSDVVELPYKGLRLSMLLIVPREINGLQVVERHLTRDLLDRNLYAPNVRRNVTLSMPKIKLEADLKLKEVLMEMGVTDVFDQRLANLSNISPAYETGLYVNSAKHKVTLKVDEEGSKAAAVTAFGIVPLSLAYVPPAPMIIRVDRPFLFFIQDIRTKITLFSGAIANPIM